MNQNIYQDFIKAMITLTVTFIRRKSQKVSFPCLLPLGEDMVSLAVPVRARFTVAEQTKDSPVGHAHRQTTLNTKSN